MSRKKIAERLELLNGGRSAYLEFLRNLTPQAVLFSFVLLIGSKLGFHYEPDNAIPTLLFVMLLGAFGLAVYANSSLFYEHCFTNWKRWLSKMDGFLKIRRVSRWRRVVAKLRAIWRNRLIEYLEVSIAIYFIQIALGIVIFLAMQSAFAILKVNNAG
ncbi:MAG: hypothetical protein WAW87_11195 [Candidatus Ferrigenium altingense]|jgi:hypothetical protein